MDTQTKLERWQRYNEWPLAAAALVFLCVCVLGGGSRRATGATINSFGKALWWSITTVTTVGYGDVYPLTNTGRVIAVLLMIGGVSLVGVVTAALASWIIQAVTEEETVSQAATEAHIDELRSEIGLLRDELRARG
jgi:voltage-gated potassium channel